MTNRILVLGCAWVALWWASTSLPAQELQPLLTGDSEVRSTESAGESQQWLDCFPEVVTESASQFPEVKIAGVVQLAAWGLGDRQFARAGHNLASATGLGVPGRVRAFEPPHTGSNFLLDEMVHVVGRKHAMKLRVISFVLAFALPVLLIGVFQVGHVLAAIAVLSHLAGVLVSRWLFFAEAEHVVGLYYGKR